MWRALAAASGELGGQFSEKRPKRAPASPGPPSGAGAAHSGPGAGFRADSNRIRGLIGAVFPRAEVRKAPCGGPFFIFQGPGFPNCGSLPFRGPSSPERGPILSAVQAPPQNFCRGAGTNLALWIGGPSRGFGPCFGPLGGTGRLDQPLEKRANPPGDSQLLFARKQSFHNPAAGINGLLSPRPGPSFQDFFSKRPLGPEGRESYGKWLRGKANIPGAAARPAPPSGFCRRPPCANAPAQIFRRFRTTFGPVFW